MQVLSLKIDKTRCVKDKKKRLFTYFLTCFFARTEWKSEYDCKIKDNNLSFWVDESLSLQVDELMYSGVRFPFVHKPMGCSVLRFAHKRNLLSYVGITKDDKQIRTWCLSRYMSFRTTLLSETSKWTIGFKQHTQTFPLTLTCKSALFLLLLYCLIITCNTDEKV